MLNNEQSSDDYYRSKYEDLNVKYLQLGKKFAEFAEIHIVTQEILSNIKSTSNKIYDRYDMILKEWVKELRFHNVQKSDKTKELNRYL